MGILNRIGVNPNSNGSVFTGQNGFCDDSVVTSFSTQYEAYRIVLFLGDPLKTNSRI